jgi:5-histidylcysteine sulfoxide synthase/putative 4-mercaptohistidine N1-methyltranferase
MVTQNINLKDGTPDEKRAEIRKYFIDTYETEELIFETLARDEVFYEQPQPLRHPLIFYFGHTATFFMNKLLIGKTLTKRINPLFESIFAIGVDEMSWDDLNDKHYEWPSVPETKEYRQKVKEEILSLIDTMEISLPINWDSPWWTIMMGIEHERIHIETSSVLIRQLPIENVKPHKSFPHCPISDKAPENRLLPVNGGKIKLGKDESHALYGWDNEYGVSEFDIEPFKASKYLVTNEEYLEFVNDGGYINDDFWCEEGLRWRNYHHTKFPSFWLESGVRSMVEEKSSFKLRCLTNEIDLPLNWPAEVCYLEAKAFCVWKSEATKTEIRLPDEAEYRLLREFVGIKEEHCDTPIKANWNFEQYASSTPVTHNLHGDFGDVVGNVWQWNETPINPFDGFKVHPLYDDFTVPTFDNRHNLITGGSWASTGNGIALNSRYAFRRHFYQHAGFRYVQSDRKLNQEFDLYETDELVSMYCEFHYGENNLNVPNFSKAIAEIGLEATKKGNHTKALDIGCSVGRTSFEIAESFDSVDALDFSTRFVQIGARMQRNGVLKYSRTEEGELVSLKQPKLTDLGLNGDYSNINFLQQDASNMKEIYTGYDLVIAANLIDRLSQPQKFLSDITERINDGGILVIASPYTWLEEFTPKENWIGGVKRDGEVVTTLDGLHDLLDESFESVGEPQRVPFVIRETKNKFQHSFSEVSIWKKK